MKRQLFVFQPFFLSRLGSASVATTPECLAARMALKLLCIMLTAEAMVTKGPRNQWGFTILDALITLCVIGALFGIFVPKYQQIAQEAQETALRSGLFNIRSSVRLFRTFNGRNPRSLEEMIEKKVILPARIGADAATGSFFEQKYLMDHAIDKKGRIIDPFGNPLVYDPLSGAVRTTTKGYESW